MNKDDLLIKDFLDFYGEFIPVPVELLVSHQYNGAGKRSRVSQSSAVLYGVLLIESKKENKKDENGLFVTITNKEIADIIGTTPGETVRKKIKELEKFNLVELGKIKPGEPYKLYIKETKKCGV